MDLVKRFLIDRDVAEQKSMFDAAVEPPKSEFRVEPPKGESRVESPKVESNPSSPKVENQEEDICEELRLLIEKNGDGCVEEHVFQDVEMFEAYNSGSSSLIPENLKNDPDEVLETASQVLTNRARLSGGARVLRYFLANPVARPLVLERRQRGLRKLAENGRLFQALVDLLEENHRLEEDVIWAFRTPGTDVKTLYDMAFFRSWFLKKLNSSSHCLTAYAWQRIVFSPAIGILTPLMYIVLPFFVLRHHGMTLSFIGYLRMLYRSFSVASTLMTSGVPGSQILRYCSGAFSLFFYFQSLFNSFEVSRMLHGICKIIGTKMRNVHLFLENARKMKSLCSEADVDVVADFLLTPTKNPAFEGLQEFSELQEFRLVSNFGESLKAFREFDAEAAAESVRYAYILDAVVAVESTRRDLDFCYVEYRPSGLAVLDIRDLWHPCLPSAKAVRNSVELTSGNIILTGPNAGGKSTLLKSILIGVIMAQTLSIAPAASVVISPFQLVRSQINVPDCKGSQSLFEAEMFRCRDALTKFRALEASGANGLVVMDEIFSSTNIVEGISGAYAVAKALGCLSRTACIISTHFAYLCKLARDDSKTENHKQRRPFANYQMPVVIDEGSPSPTHSLCGCKISYPYQLKPGISQQYIALELLRKNGFDEELLAIASEVRDRLTSSRRKSGFVQESQNPAAVNPEKVDDVRLRD
jgi:energy-coupling factor transporter ATP-binding protein EcfA2